LPATIIISVIAGKDKYSGALLPDRFVKTNSKSRWKQNRLHTMRILRIKIEFFKQEEYRKLIWLKL
jgi:hypothetical protein